MADLYIAYRNPEIEWDRMHNILTTPEDKEKGIYLSFHDKSIAGHSFVEEYEWQIHRKKN